MGMISSVGLALATSELATTDLPERSHQHRSDLFFLKSSFWKRSVIPGYYQHSFSSLCYSCMKLFNEKKNKTSTKADPAFVSSA